MTKVLQTGYIVNLRVVVKSHDHRSIEIFVPHNDNPKFTNQANNEEMAGERATEQIRGMKKGGGVVWVEGVSTVRYFIEGGSKMAA